MLRILPSDSGSLSSSELDDSDSDLPFIAALSDLSPSNTKTIIRRICVYKKYLPFSTEPRHLLMKHRWLQVVGNRQVSSGGQVHRQRIHVDGRMRRRSREDSLSVLPDCGILFGNITNIGKNMIEKIPKRKYPIHQAPIHSVSSGVRYVSRNKGTSLGTKVRL